MELPYLGFVPMSRIYGAVAVAIFLVILYVVFGGRKKQDAHHRLVRCATCGWKGSVSAYKPTCPKCGGKQFE